MTHDFVQILAHTAQEERRDQGCEGRAGKAAGTAREHRSGCARAQPSTGLVPRQSQGWEEAEAAQGAPSPQHWNRNWNCAWPSSPELREHRDSCRRLWDQSSTAASPALSQAELPDPGCSSCSLCSAPREHLSVVYIRRRQKHFSCAHPAVCLSSGLYLPF